MFDKKTVNVVFIGRVDMYAKLYEEYNDLPFGAVSVTYRGLVRESEDISPTIDAKKISAADRIFILCSLPGDLDDYIKRLKEVGITLTAKKFIVMVPEKYVEGMKKKLPGISFSATLSGNLQNRLLQLYRDNDPNELRKEFDAHQKRKSEEKKAPSSPLHGPNPNADLPDKQREMEIIADNIEHSSREIVEIVARDQITDKESVDRAMTRLEESQRELSAAVQKYKARIENENANVKAAMNKPVDDISKRANIAYNAAVDAKKKLDEKVAEVRKMEEERQAAIAAAVLARRQRLAELEDQRILSVVAFEIQAGIPEESLEEYLVSAKRNEGIADTVCVVFDPSKEACEDHLRAAVERIKGFQNESNPHVRVVFLRAVPYVATTSGHFGDLETTSEQDHDMSMITRFGVQDPVIITNLAEFKHKAGYGPAVVFKKNEEALEPASPLSANSSFVVDESSEPPAKKQKPAPNPHRFKGKDVAHARFERTAKLTEYFHTKKAQGNIDLKWLELNLLSMPSNCQTAKFINTEAGINVQPEGNVKVKLQEDYKVVIDLLSLQSKEEQRWKPKLITFWANANYAEKYIAKRTAQRNLIYTTAETIYQALKEKREVTAATINQILAAQGVAQRNGHVQIGIIKILEKNYPGVKGQIHFPAEVARMEPAVGPGPTR